MCSSARSRALSICWSALPPRLLVGKLRRLVQRLVAALLTLFAVEGVLRLVCEASEVHARLLPGRGVMTGGVPGRSSDDSKKVQLRECAWPGGSASAVTWVPWN